MGTPSDDTTSSKLVVNNVLCYTTSARDNLRSDDIIRTCLAFYNQDDIVKGKDILFEFVGERPIRRRNNDRLLHEMQDIMDMLKKCDDEKIKLPTFVCDDYRGLPPTSGFEVIGHRLITLVEEISTLKHEVNALREARFANAVVSQVNSTMQEDIITIKGELRKLNLKLMSENIRRNSLLLFPQENKISSPRTNVNERNGGECNGNENNSSLYEMMNDRDKVDNHLNVIPNAPDATTTDNWIHRFLYDEGGSPSAPPYADVCASQFEREREFIDSPLIRSYQEPTSSAKRKSPKNKNKNSQGHRVLSGDSVSSSAGVGGDGGGGRGRVVADVWGGVRVSCPGDGDVSLVPAAAAAVVSAEPAASCGRSLVSSAVGVAVPASGVAGGGSVLAAAAPDADCGGVVDVPGTSGNNVDQEDNFILVQSRKKKNNNEKKNFTENRIIGKKKNIGTLRSAKRTADLYIGNCDINVTSDVLIKYIRDELNVIVCGCEQLESKYDDYNSFKVTLESNNRLKLLSSDMWPEGIVCRRFYKPRHNI